MDSYSAADVARRMGTSVPRVVRAAERLGLGARRSTNGRWELSGEMVKRLEAELGSTPPIDGLSQSEVKVLAALARAPRGLASARIVAGVAAVSPTTASTALRALEGKGLVFRERTTISAGRAREVELVHADRRVPEWPELASQLSAVVLPARRPPRPRSVPARLGHLFWNTAPSQLDLRTSGSYIARRLLSTADLEGLAWGAENLRAGDWEAAAQARALDPRTRALALNLAGA